MPNWWEDASFLPGSWSNIQSGSQSRLDAPHGQMDFLNPDSSMYSIPWKMGAQTGQGIMPGLGSQGMGGNNGMDPYYGYGALFGSPSGGQSGQLAALGPHSGQIGGGDVLQPQAWNPAGGGGGHGGWNPNIGGGGAAAPPGPATTQGNVTYSPVGPQETLLDKLFKGSVTGKGGGPIANMLYNLGLGQLPPALAEQIIGKTNEQFGNMGARFGTDLGTAQARGLAQASEAQSLAAIQQILGLGGTTAGFQFTRGESALERAMKEFISQQQTDPLTSILQSLLQGGG